MVVDEFVKTSENVVRFRLAQGDKTIVAVWYPGGLIEVENESHYSPLTIEAVESTVREFVFARIKPKNWIKAIL